MTEVVIERVVVIVNHVVHFNLRVLMQLEIRKKVIVVTVPTVVQKQKGGRNLRVVDLDRNIKLDAFAASKEKDIFNADRVTALHFLLKSRGLDSRIHLSSLIVKMMNNVQQN